MSRLEIYGVDDVIEYHSVDKSEWKLGEWTEEPDKVQFIDRVTQFPCLIVRNPMGALCGYVGISSRHPYFGLSYADTALDWIHVHGGLTFSDRCQHDSPQERGICHLVPPGGDDNIWWLGFDCLHLGDYAPRDSCSSLNGYDYKNLTYVLAEIQRLAAQLKGCLDE